MAILHIAETAIRNQIASLDKQAAAIAQRKAEATARLAAILAQIEETKEGL